MIRILMICHGNICRSPMAEFIMKDLVEKKGLCNEFIIESRATSTEEIWNGIGNPIYPPARDELRKHHIGNTAYTNFTSKRARQLTKQDYDDYDYLLCADRNNINNTLRIIQSDPEHKLHLLLDYCDNQLKGKAIADPWYSGDFVTTYHEIVEGCTALLQYLGYK